MGAEGAFGTVEKRKMVDKDGKETFMAVKKLKRQEMNLNVRSPLTSAPVGCMQLLFRRFQPVA